MVFQGEIHSANEKGKQKKIVLKEKGECCFHIYFCKIFRLNILMLAVNE